MYIIDVFADFFSYDFLIRALVAGVFCATVAAVLGNFLVASRQSVMSDMLAHTSLAGVGVGILFALPIDVTSTMIGIFASMVLFLLSRQKKIPPEAISVVLLSGGIAIAILCVHIGKNASVNLETFLFGSILTISQSELSFFVILCCFLLAVSLVLYNKFLCFVLDKDFFSSQFQHWWWAEVLFFMMMGTFVALSLKIIGGLLITSLLVISVLSAQYFSYSFRQSVFYSIFLNVFCVVLGLFWSFYADIPTSSAIVISLIIVFFGAFLVQSMIKIKNTIAK